MAKKTIVVPLSPAEELAASLERVQSELKEINLRKFRNDELVRSGIHQMRATTTEILQALKTA